jgi:hypothetical protein
MMPQALIASKDQECESHVPKKLLEYDGDLGCLNYTGVSRSRSGRQSQSKRCLPPPTSGSNMVFRTHACRYGARTREPHL